MVSYRNHPRFRRRVRSWVQIKRLDDFLGCLWTLLLVVAILFPLVDYGFGEKERAQGIVRGKDHSIQQTNDDPIMFDDVYTVDVQLPELRVSVTVSEEVYDHAQPGDDIWVWLTLGRFTGWTYATY